MLQRLRDKTQGWIAGIIIGILVLAMGLWGISSYLDSGSASGGVLAKFNGIEITQAEVDNAYNRFQMQNRKPELNSIAATKLLKQQILEQLINQKLLAYDAHKNNLFIGQDQLNSVLLQIPAFQADGQFSRAQFQGVVERMLFTVPGFLQNMRETMLVNQMQSGMMGTAFSLPYETENGLALVKQQRTFSYALLDKSRVMNHVTVSPAQIKAYYEKNQNNYMLPEKVSLQYVTLSAKQIMDGLKPTQAELLNFYQANISDYTQPVRWHVAHILITGSEKQAEKVYQQTKSGKNFASLAREYSQDPLSAKQGGQLAWFGPGQLDPAFETAVSNLKVGEISTPISTKYGFEIIKLLAAKSQKSLPYHSVSDKVRQAYLLKQAQSKFNDLKDQLANDSFENPGTLTTTASALHLKINTTSSFTRQGGGDSFTKLPQIIMAAFSSDVLDGNNSDVVTVTPDEVAVIRVLKHQPASVKPLSMVSGAINDALKQQMINQQLDALGKQIITAIQSGQSMAKINSQYHLSWKAVMLATMQQNKTVNAVILDEAFSLSRPKNKPTVGGVSLANNDYAIVILKDITNGKYINTSKSERKIFADRMQKTIGQVEYLEYVNYLHKQAKIKLSSDKD